jgi:hypothetical protein
VCIGLIRFRRPLLIDETLQQQPRQLVLHPFVVQDTVPKTSSKVERAMATSDGFLYNMDSDVGLLAVGTRICGTLFSSVVARDAYLLKDQQPVSNAFSDGRLVISDDCVCVANRHYLGVRLFGVQGGRRSAWVLHGDRVAHVLPG